ncbi:cytochrome P450 1A1-like [Ptychodera flava]|uniref:cytochrome P450 1A1-like n=1 Tax=Ptychodera flava TaxID=63121 RepID=UPI00396A5E81
MLGPRGWPVVGSLLSLGELPHETFSQMAKIYGNVFKVRLGNRTIVVVNGMKAVRDALLKQAVTFAGRPKFFSMQRHFPSRQRDEFDRAQELQLGFLREQIKKHQLTLKDGNPEDVIDYLLNIRKYGRETEVDIVQKDESIAAMLDSVFGAGEWEDPDQFKPERFLSEDGESLNKVKAAKLASFSFGKRRCPGTIQYDQKATEYLTGSGALDDFLPLFRHFPSRQRNEFDRVLELEINLLHERIKEHHLTLKDGNPEDVIDYLLNIRKYGRETEVDIVQKDEKVAAMLVSVFGAGFDTLGKSLYVFFLYMILYPNVQEKAQQEIDAVIGRDRPPAVTDRLNLPYVDCLIYELLRHATLAPLSVPHATVNDTKFYGYDIPKETPVFPNLHSANFDETEWEDPDLFKPERFLSQDGQSLNKVKAAKLASFSFGKRRCPGEQLAQKELFLFITLFLQRCTINKCPGDDPKLKWNHGLSLTPDRFKILTTPRNPLSDKA